MSYRRSRARRGGSGLGLLLVAFGILFLAGSLFGAGFWSLVWPMVILAPGLLLFALVKRLGKSAAILTIPATMISTLGLMLAVQNLLGLWGTWAYAWALLVPGSLGMGLAVYGELARKPTAERWGENLAKAGLGIFLVGLVLNVLFGVGGFMMGLLGVLALPLLLIVAGIFLLRRGRKPATRHVSGRPYGELGDGTSRLDATLFQDERERV